MVLDINSLTCREQLIYSLIPTGHRQAITKVQLAKLSGLSEREAREIIYSLVVKHGLPIGSCTEPTGGGYFVIQDEADLAVATRHLLPRAKAIIRRTRALEKIAQEKFSCQLKLVLED
ncbi:hypothetical protein [Desulfotomaculum nigrificans]|uniref:hypothetical protein n=1 Tax=Desulfotomaculum nigrificans TaxID=1565 RepID=UPI0001FAE550|nr:hypothetical protein [Desulfotomaculum nigrificans]MDA8235941.1 DNA replication protein [Clostridia bacterium]